MDLYPEDPYPLVHPVIIERIITKLAEAFSRGVEGGARDLPDFFPPPLAGEPPVIFDSGFYITYTNYTSLNLLTS